MSFNGARSDTAGPLNMFWFIPVSGDGRYLGTNTGRRPAEHKYYREVALAIDRLGYGGALIPTGPECDDGWVVASALATVTERMQFLVAVRPGIISPTFAARQAASLDRLSNGRLLLNVVTGGTPSELAGDAALLPHDDRYVQTSEFLHIWRRLMQGETVDFSGKYYRIEGGRISFQPVQQPYPPLWLGGSSEPAKDVAAEHIDLYLTYAEPLEQVEEKINSVRTRAVRLGRHVRFGMRVHMVVRETADEAWAAANRLISHVTDETIAAAQQRFTAGSDSVGQSRMAALHRGRRDRLEVRPNLWAGIGLVRTGAATALVGDPATVAERLREYQALGIDTIIASGYPHLEEAYRIAELLFPELGIKQLGHDLRESPAAEFDPARLAAQRAASASG